MLGAVVVVNAGDYDKTLDISFMASCPSSVKDEDNVLLQELFKKHFNFEVDFEGNGTGSHLKKLDLLIATGELPDLVAMMLADDAKRLGPEGLLVPLSDYFDKMPNFKKKIIEDPSIYVNAMAGDGKIYNAQRFYTPSSMTCPIMRIDLLNEVGLEPPKTYQELYHALKAIRSKHPELPGIMFMGAVDPMNFLNQYGTSFNTARGMFYNSEIDRWEYGPSNKGYAALVTYFKKLWDEDLIDPEFFITTKKMYEEKIQNGQFMFTRSWANTARYEEHYEDNYPGEDVDYNMIEPLTSEVFGKRRLAINDGTAGTSWVINANISQEKIDRLIKVIDYMYTLEGNILARAGIEGIHHERTEDGLIKYLPPIKAPYNPPEADQHPKKVYGLNNPHFERISIKSLGLMYEERDEYDDFIEINNKCIEKYGYKTNKAIRLSFSEEQQEKMQQIEANLQTYVDEYTVRFITGNKPLSELPDFQKSLKNYGMEDLEKIYEEAYEVYKERLAKANL